MKEYIFKEFSNKLENESDIDNILNLIDCLEGKNKKEDNQINGQKEISNYHFRSSWIPIISNSGILHFNEYHI